MTLSKDKLNIITKLSQTVFLQKLNLNLIKKNSEYLYNLHGQIKPLYKNIIHKPNILYNKNETYKEIIKIINNSLIGENFYIKEKVAKTDKIIKLTNENINFYYINLGNYEKDINIINNLFNQSICLAKYKMLNKQNIIIIWIPVEKKRDYDFDIINNENLEKSINNFEAFTASGVTFNYNPKITIITRYEEITKLLLHELIHNYGIDGSQYHNNHNKLINNYKTIKNSKNYDYEYSIYESYTELLSSYLNLVFKNLNLNSNKDLLEKFKVDIIIETLYSYNTIANLIKLNNYKNYEEFEKKLIFKGNICMYEYYFLKALLYNNYELTIPNKKEDYEKNYQTIININKNDPLLKDVYKNYIKQHNFSYIFYDTF
jgi:hypothetical protein